MPQPNFEYRNIVGVSKKHDPTRILPGYVVFALNVDSDNDKKLHRRRGITPIDSTSTHSQWSNQWIALCVQSGVLQEVSIDFITKTATYTPLQSGVGDTEMIFQTVGDMVFLSNGDIFGYIRDHVAHGLPLIDEEDYPFKTRMTGGHLMEYWDSRLFVFQNNILIFSDPGEPMVRDKRHNYTPFNGRGRMLKSVKDGLYVSDTKHCGFLQGGTGDPPKWNYTEVCDFPAIEGMAISIVHQTSGTALVGGRTEKIVLWATEDGCYMGLPGGQVNRVTGDHFWIEGAAKGRVAVLYRILKNQVKIRQFLGVYDLQPGYGGAQIAFGIPAIQVSGRITTG